MAKYKVCSALSIVNSAYSGTKNSILKIILVMKALLNLQSKKRIKNIQLLFGDNKKQTIFALPFKTGKKIKVLCTAEWVDN
jgi:hypothetical protein